MTSLVTAARDISSAYQNSVMRPERHNGRTFGRGMSEAATPTVHSRMIPRFVCDPQHSLRPLLRLEVLGFHLGPPPYLLVRSCPISASSSVTDMSSPPPDTRTSPNRALSCGETSFRVDPVRAVNGLFQWRDAINAAMQAQSLNALGQSCMLIGNENVIRLDAPETPRPIRMDEHERANVESPTMARALMEGSSHLIDALFLGEAATRYEPCTITKVT